MIDKKINEKSTIKLNFDLIKQEVKANLSNSFTPKKNKAVALVSLLSLLLSIVVILLIVNAGTQLFKVANLKRNVAEQLDKSFQEEYISNIFNDGKVGVYSVYFPDFHLFVDVVNENYCMVRVYTDKKSGFTHEFLYKNGEVTYTNGITSEKCFCANYNDPKSFLLNLITIEMDLSNSNIKTSLADYEHKYPDIIVKGKTDKNNKIIIRINYIDEIIEITDFEFEYTYKVKNPDYPDLYEENPKFEFYNFIVYGKVNGNEETVSIDIFK